MTPEEIKAIHTKGQSESVAFELDSIPLTRLAQTLAAFANTQGGVLLLGIDPKTNAVRGLRYADYATEKTLSAGLKCDPPLILPRPQVAMLDEKEILYVEIPEGLSHAYALRGKFPTRSGKKNVALGPRQLRELLRARGEANFEMLPAPGASLVDLDDDAIDAYAARFLGEVPNRRAAILDLLFRRGCVTKEDGKFRPTISGYLLFAKEPQRAFPSAEISIARYAGREMSDEFLRETILGSLPEQVRRAESFVIANMRKGARIDGLEREDRAEYPAPVLREAIVNAVAHRDYAIRGDEIRVLMFGDRIEVYSPGKLPGHVTVDNIAEERFARNEIIVQVLADLGLGEKLGYGIDRMIRMMREWGLPAPRFVETANGFKVTLRGPGERMVSAEADRSKWRNADLNERQHAALEFIAKQRRITNRDYREMFPEVSEETIRRDLADLVENGILLKMGDKKGTYYILK